MSKNITAIWGNKENDDGDRVYYLLYSGTYLVDNGNSERRGYHLQDQGDDLFVITNEEFAIKRENLLCTLKLKPRNRVFKIPFDQRVVHWKLLQKSIQSVK